MQRDTVTVERFYTQQASPLQLKMLGGASGLKRVIHESTVNRPGLVLAGFTRYFAHKRVQILGNAEMSFIRSLRKSQRLECYRRLLMLTNHPVPCVVLCRNAHPDRMFLKMAEEAGIPVFSCPFVTMKFISLGTIALEAM